jgi:hypothetical protein
VDVTGSEPSYSDPNWKVYSMPIPLVMNNQAIGACSVRGFNWPSHKLDVFTYISEYNSSYTRFGVSMNFINSGTSTKQIWVYHIIVGY